MATNDVITLTEAKQYLDVTGTTEHDTELPVFITAISRRLDNLIGPIVRRTVTSEKQDGGSTTIYLAKYPIYQITTVVEYDLTDPLTLSVESNTSKPADAYMLDPYGPDPTLYSNRLRRRYGGVSGTFVPGRLNVEITYQAGRVANTASVSEDVKLAAGMMLKNAWKSQEIGTTRIGDFDVPQSTFPTIAIPRFVKEMFKEELQEPRVYLS